MRENDADHWSARRGGFAFDEDRSERGGPERPPLTSCLGFAKSEVSGSGQA